MKVPETPPVLRQMIAKLDPTRISTILDLTANPIFKKLSRHHIHWDRLKRKYNPPKGFTMEEVWLAIKLQRVSVLKPIPLLDKQGNPFTFCVPEFVWEKLHRIDMGAGSTIGVAEQITNPQTKDQYLIRSLMEEAITSSQLEGAATTREVAKEMIRTGRPPINTDEQMILNNYATMQRIRTLKDELLSPKIVFEIHRMVTEKTLEDNSAAGRFRSDAEKRVVGDEYGEIYHDPPPSAELEARLKAMCDFANAVSPEPFVHPVVRAIILHFWLAYDHPFVDGNGRTARAIFYWAMLKAKYWLFEYISISTILRKAPIKYGRSFLYTETDENDLTYFIVGQTVVIEQAIQALHDYIIRKAEETKELESCVRAVNLFNHRQVAVIRHALKHPYQAYTIDSHRLSHNVVYQTARTDLLDLAKKGLLISHNKIGKKMVFGVPQDLNKRLKKLEAESPE